MSLIKFPSHIKPARVTVSLLRVDETIRSPLTNVQQVISRGTAAWKWTYEYTDLTDSERDMVQAFLMNCRGSVNNFMVTDPGDYEIKLSMSDWIDIFSGYGSFNVTAGSDTNKVNSWFNKSANFNHHVTEEKTVRFEWRKRLSAGNLSWRGTGVSNRVNSLQAGKAYVQRIKHFNGSGKTAFFFRVGSVGAGAYYIQSAPFRVSSTAMVSAPFYPNVSTVTAGIVDWINQSPIIGNHFEYADYRLARCALVSNSENLLTRSNEFDHADWTAINVTVASGWGDASPTGANSGSWKLFSDAQVNTRHYIEQSYTKIATEDIYTLAVYGRTIDDNMAIGLYLEDGTSGNSFARIKLVSSQSILNSVANPFIRNYGSFFDVGSGFFRCGLTVLVSSLTVLTARIYITNSQSDLNYTGNGSAGIEIFGAQLRKFPFMGQYVPTVATAVIGSGWQTGSKLTIDGLDPEDSIATGQRFEVVNQFHDDPNNLYERSEFKRITKELKVHREGYVELEFDPPIRNAAVTNRATSEQDNLGETMHNPVIFHQPEMKARLMAGTIVYTDRALKAMDLTFDVLEDMTS